MRKEMEEKLRSLGIPLPSSKQEKLQLLWNMVTEFCQSFKNTIRGRLITTFSQKEKAAITGGAKIKQYYSKLYEEFQERGFSVTSQYSDPDVERAIKQHEGYSMPGFPSVDVFNYLLKPCLGQIKEPALECL